MEIADPFPLAFIVNTKIVINTIDSYAIISIIISVFLIILSALISGAESAYFNLKPVQVKEFEKNQDIRSRLVKKHLKKPEKFLATLTIANSFFNVCFIVLMGVVLNRIFDFTQLPTLGFLIQIAIIAFILLLFGEILPKSYAKKKAKKFARITAIPIIILDRLFHPFSLFMINTTSLIGKKLAKNQYLISLINRLPV